MTAVLPVAPGQRRSARVERAPVATRWRFVAAAATGGAGVLHGVAAAQHLGEAPTLTAGFVLTAAVQLGMAGWLLLGRRGSGWDSRTVQLALWATVGFLLVLLVGHTTDWLTPLHGTAAGHGGHATGHAVQTAGAVALGLDAPVEVEPLGALGTTTGALEVLAVLGLAALLPAATRRRTTTGLLVLGLAAWTAWATGVLG
ncbi:hypothetical protein [Klenkia brasiliensis]|uniref:Uncharacterized protein n=1 Tax=Klenkia brasiliensis TaxID=333142 RepID=A0A1G7T9T0_9ACTN|nr:hypothetical protein [Klenkia brasiliensis]SDG31360.1 hypothetical protein SAMN05660324_2349 [Klenkia brasiliensis]